MLQTDRQTDMCLPQTINNGLFINDPSIIKNKIKCLNRIPIASIDLVHSINDRVWFGYSINGQNIFSMKLEEKTV